VAIKILESWRYSQGIVSAHVAGLCDRVMFMPDNTKANIVERTMDTLNVLIGAKTGQDMTTNYSLAAWPMHNSGEAWEWEYDSDAEEAHMKDEDDAWLKHLQVLDISPTIDLTTDETDEAVVNVAVRAYKLTAVRGLAYTFYGAKVFNGLGHGMTVIPQRHDYPRARNKAAGKLYARPLGSEDADDWELVEEGISSDDHGHWASAAQRVLDDDVARSVLEYAILSRGQYIELGRFATREYALAQAWLNTSPQPHLCKDAAGRLWLVHNQDGDILVKHRDSPQRAWEEHTDAFGEGDHEHPTIATMPDGALLVSATRASSQETEIVRSTDDGESWSAVT